MQIEHDEGTKYYFSVGGQTPRESPLLCIPIKTIRTLAYFARRMRRFLDILCGIMSPWSGNNLTWGDETAKRNKSVDERLWLKNITGPKEKQNSNCGTRNLGSVETDIAERGDVFCFGCTEVLTYKEKKEVTVVCRRSLGFNRKKWHLLKFVHLHAQIDLNMSPFLHLRESQEGQFIQKSNIIKTHHHSSQAVWPHSAGWSSGYLLPSLQGNGQAPYFFVHVHGKRCWSFIAVKCIGQLFQKPLTKPLSSHRPGWGCLPIFKPGDPLKVRINFPIMVLLTNGSLVE